MLPKDLVKPISELKNPFAKILIVCLILSVISLTSYIILEERSKKKDCKDEIIYLNKKVEEKEKIIADLNIDIHMRDYDERQRLLKKEQYFDSIINLINGNKK